MLLVSGADQGLITLLSVQSLTQKCGSVDGVKKNHPCAFAFNRFVATKMYKDKATHVTKDQKIPCSSLHKMVSYDCSTHHKV